MKKKLGISLMGLSIKIPLNYYNFFFYFYSDIFKKLTWLTIKQKNK